VDLFLNENPRFTRWLVSSGGLREPFVVIDVGVQGGESVRWRSLGDQLVVHGFDALEEAIADLRRRNARLPNKVFHGFAIGDEDGEREFFHTPGNPTNSSFHGVPGSNMQARRVPVRRLDTLLRDGIIPRGDFLKVDVEGFEKEVLRGAGELLAGGILGIECETNFRTSLAYPRSHFGEIHDIVLRHGLVLFDLNCNRIPRPVYQRQRRRRNLAPLPAEGNGMPATFNVLFCRELPAERDGSLHYPQMPAPPSVDQVLKAMAIYELHGFNDIAVQTALAFADELGARLDVERAIDLLCQAEVLASEPELGSLWREIEALRASTSWRITAPLRLLGNALKRRS
jgi:FkbM family methyltransferase